MRTTKLISFLVFFFLGFLLSLQYAFAEVLITDGVYIYDGSWKVTTANATYDTITLGGTALSNAKELQFIFISDQYNYTGFYRNTKNVPMYFTVKLKDSYGLLFFPVNCAIRRILKDLYNSKEILANNVSEQFNNNETKTYSYTFSDTSVSHYNDTIEVICKDLVGHETKNVTYKVFYRFDIEFIDETGGTKGNYNRTYILLCNSGTLFKKFNENETADSMTIIAPEDCTWLSITTDYSGLPLVQDFDIDLFTKYQGNDVKVCVPSSGRQYVIKHLVASEPYPDYIISIINPNTGCYVAGSRLHYYEQGIYYFSVPTILNEKYAVQVQNVYVTAITGSETSVDVSLLIKRLIDLQKKVASLVPDLTYNITHELTDTNLRIYITAKQKIKEVKLYLYRGRNKIGELTIPANNKSVVISIIRSQYDNFGLNETLKEFIRFIIIFDNGFSISGVYPKLPYGTSLPTILVWVIATLLILYFFGTYGHYYKIIYSGLAIAILTGLLSFLSGNLAPIIFASSFFLMYCLDWAIATFLTGIEKQDILIRLALFISKLTIVSVLMSSILSSLAIPLEVPFKADIDKIQEIIADISFAIENMFASPLQTILTVFNVVLKALVLIWYSIKVLISLIVYLLNFVFGGILPVSAIATGITALLIILFIIALIRALIFKPAPPIS